MSSLAVATAAIPQVVDSYRKPRETPLLIYIGYIVANILALLGGNDWSIEERFYPICAGLVCCAVVLAASRRWLKS